MRKLFVGLAIITLPTVLLAAPDSAKTLRQLQKAAAAADANDCNTTLKVIAPLLPEAVAKLPEETQAAAYDLAVPCALQLNNSDDAYRYAMQATPLAKSSDYIWRMRLAIELDSGRDDAALKTKLVSACKKVATALIENKNALTPLSFFWERESFEVR